MAMFGQVIADFWQHTDMLQGFRFVLGQIPGFGEYAVGILAKLGLGAFRDVRQIGMDEAYPGATTPFPWMSEMIDLKKEKNFFETRVTEYQTGGALDWDDE